MALSSDSELTPLIKSIMQLAKRLVDAERFSVYSVDSDNQQLFSQISEVYFLFYNNLVGNIFMVHCRDSHQERLDPRQHRMWLHLERKSQFLMLTCKNSFRTKLILRALGEISFLNLLLSLSALYNLFDFMKVCCARLLRTTMETLLQSLRWSIRERLVFYSFSF